MTSLLAKTTSNIRIRLARETDAEAISSLLFDSFVEYKSLYNPESFAATVIPPDQIASRISEGPVWIAVAGERIVGTVSVVPKGGSLYVRGMAVLPVVRGRRTGERLLTTVEQFALMGGLSANAFEHYAFFGSGDSSLRTFWFPANKRRTAPSLWNTVVFYGKGDLKQILACRVWNDTEGTLNYQVPSSFCKEAML